MRQDKKNQTTQSGRGADEEKPRHRREHPEPRSPLTDDLARQTAAAVSRVRAQAARIHAGLPPSAPPGPPPDAT